MNTPFWPVYNVESAALRKWRAKAKRSLLSKEDKQAYGAAVEAAVKASQRAALMRVTAKHRINCASGTEYNNGEEIHAAVKRQQINALLAYPEKVRRSRTPTEWRDMYAKAMAEKRRVLRKAS